MLVVLHNDRIALVALLLLHLLLQRLLRMRMLLMVMMIIRIRILALPVMMRQPQGNVIWDDGSSNVFRGRVSIGHLC